MQYRFSLTLCLMFISLSLHPALAESPALQIGASAPAFTLQGADGKPHSLGDYKGRIVVLEWTNPGCPYVRKHYGSGAMQKLQADMTGQNVAWLRIDSSAEGQEGYLTPDTARKLAASDGSHQTQFLLDPDGKVGHLYNATTTPNMFVIAGDGTLRYMGAIDDMPSTDSATLANAKNYVREAVAAVLKNQPVPHPVTQPYGCSVKYGS